MDLHYQDCGMCCHHKDAEGCVVIANADIFLNYYLLRECVNASLIHFLSKMTYGENVNKTWKVGMNLEELYENQIVVH